MLTSNYKEKREYPRFQIGIPVVYSCPDSNETAETRTHDISSQGLGIVTEKEIPLGTLVKVRLVMPDNGEEIIRQGYVVWSKQTASGKCRTGIRLQEPTLKPIMIVLRTIDNKLKS